ncbi:MAG: histidinol dehydrogenase [Gammaproteobacteria bacterium]|nr:histidinol dehydrogenase [Gammaproteobacteria bacterium]
MTRLLTRLDTKDPDFSGQLALKCQLPAEDLLTIQEDVSVILRRVRQEGDKGLLALVQTYDGLQADAVSSLSLGRDEMKAASERINKQSLEALKAAADRVRQYHERQKAAAMQSWSYQDSEGNTLGQRVRPLERVGIYVPGGKAAYPSSVIMTAIPAKVAGVTELILVSPVKPGPSADLVLAAAGLCDVDRVFTIGGAQAVGALAYGTETVPAVDKIVGPGNIYVATAKRLVYGRVGIDMFAGPSEVVIVADKSANPEWVLMDMLAQAEHDEMAQAVLISPFEDLLNRVEQLLGERLDTMNRKGIIRASLAGRGMMIKTRDLAEAVAISNSLAPEHLELAVTDPEAWLPTISKAGAIFLGQHSAEVLGDYSAGPSHVLPTGGAARFSSPLGVYDFLVQTSIIHCSARGAVKLARDAAILAREEGLQAHAFSADLRCQG